MRVYGRARVWSCECVCLCECGYVDLGFSWLHVFLMLFLWRCTCKISVVYSLYMYVCVYGGARVGSCECKRHSFRIASGCLLAFVEESRAPCSLPGLLGHSFLDLRRVFVRVLHVRP